MIKRPAKKLAESAVGKSVMRFRRRENNNPLCQIAPPSGKDAEHNPKVYSVKARQFCIAKALLAENRFLFFCTVS